MLISTQIDYFPLTCLSFQHHLVITLLYPGLEPGASALGVLRATIAPVKQNYKLTDLITYKQQTELYSLQVSVSVHARLINH